MFRKVCLYLMIVIALWGTARFCHAKTRGFRISKLRGNISRLPHQYSPPLPQELQITLNQKFHFFGRGLQSFSFLSDDQTTVLKIFNNHYQQRLFWLQSFPFRNFFRDKIAYNQKKLDMTFESYQLAFDALKEETGLLFFHPKPCRDCPKVTLIDPLGIAHAFDLSQSAFVLQKKATLVFSHLEKCASNQDLKKAKEAIDSLISLLKTKMNRGIGDRDPLIRTNLGFYNDCAMQIDIGPLYHDETLKNKENQKKEILKITLSLKHWMEKHHPELTPYLYEALENL